MKILCGLVCVYHCRVYKSSLIWGLLRRHPELVYSGFWIVAAQYCSWNYWNEGSG